MCIQLELYIHALYNTAAHNNTAATCAHLPNAAAQQSHCVNFTNPVILLKTTRRT